MKYKTPESLGITSRTIIPLAEGWLEKSYYVVDIAVKQGSVIHKAIFYTGFLHNGEPWGYNSIGVFNQDDTIRCLQDLFYCRAVKLIGKLEDYKIGEVTKLIKTVSNRIESA